MGKLGDVRPEDLGPDELEAGRVLVQLAGQIQPNALVRFGDVLKRCGLAACDETREADSSSNGEPK